MLVDQTLPKQPYLLVKTGQTAGELHMGLGHLAGAHGRHRIEPGILGVQLLATFQVQRAAQKRHGVLVLLFGQGFLLFGSLDAPKQRGPFARLQPGVQLQALLVEGADLVFELGNHPDALFQLGGGGCRVAGDQTVALGLQLLQLAGAGDVGVQVVAEKLVVCGKLLQLAGAVERRLQLFERRAAFLGLGGQMCPEPFNAPGADARALVVPARAFRKEAAGAEAVLHDGVTGALAKLLDGLHANQAAKKFVHHGAGHRVVGGDLGGKGVGERLALRLERAVGINQRFAFAVALELLVDLQRLFVVVRDHNGKLAGERQLDGRAPLFVGHFAQLTQLHGGRFLPLLWKAPVQLVEQGGVHHPVRLQIAQLLLQPLQFAPDGGVLLALGPCGGLHFVEGGLYRVGQRAEGRAQCLGPGVAQFGNRLLQPVQRHLCSPALPGAAFKKFGGLFLKFRGQLQAAGLFGGHRFAHRTQLVDLLHHLFDGVLQLQHGGTPFVAEEVLQRLKRFPLFFQVANHLVVGGLLVVQAGVQRRQAVQQVGMLRLGGFPAVLDFQKPEHVGVGAGGFPLVAGVDGFFQPLRLVAQPCQFLRDAEVVLVALLDRFDLDFLGLKNIAPAELVKPRQKGERHGRGHEEVDRFAVEVKVVGQLFPIVGDITE